MKAKIVAAVLALAASGVITTATPAAAAGWETCWGDPRDCGRVVDQLNVPIEIAGNRVSWLSCTGSEPIAWVSANSATAWWRDVDALYVPAGKLYLINGSWQGPGWICVHNGSVATVTAQRP